MTARNRICIKDGVVVNIIYADDDFVDLLTKSNQFDKILDQSDYSIVTINPGYKFDGNGFSSPPSDLDINAQVQIKIQKAIMGFNTIMVQFAASNVIGGITQAGKTQLIADALEDVQRYGQSGSLYAAISALQSVSLTSEMKPFLDPSVIASLIAQAQAVLANL